MVHQFGAWNSGLAPRSCGVGRGRFAETVVSFMERTMANEKLFDELGARIKEVLANSPVRDVEKNLRAMLAATFARLDLVTREEFDVQSEVLARTREKLVQLEARLAELEKGGRTG